MSEVAHILGTSCDNQFVVGLKGERGVGDPDVFSVPDYGSDGKLLQSGKVSFLDFFSNQVTVAGKIDVEIVFPDIIGETEPGYFLTR